MRTLQFQNGVGGPRTVTPPQPPAGDGASLQFFNGEFVTGGTNQPNMMSSGGMGGGVYPPQGRIGGVLGDSGGATVSSVGHQQQPAISGPFLPPIQFIGGSSGGGGGSSSTSFGAHHQSGGTGDTVDDFNDEPPLLEELGIHPDHILKRMKSVLFFYRLDHDLLVDSDMCGPLFVAMCLVFCLLLSGKIHFGYIYGLRIVGCLGSYLLLNLMSSQDTLDLYRTMSILGYGLIPVVLLAFISIFLPLVQAMAHFCQFSASCGAQPLRQDFSKLL